MLTDSVLVAIAAALGADLRCRCGRDLTPVERDGALWLVCDSNRTASRLPLAIASFVRTHLHDSTFIAARQAEVEAAAEPVRSTGVARPLAAAA